MLKNEKSKRKKVAWLAVPLSAALIVTVGLQWMGSRGIYLRPIKNWMGPEQKLVSATPTNPTRIAFVTSRGILTFKRPIPISTISHRPGFITYSVASDPELPDGFSVEFPDPLKVVHVTREEK